MDDRPVAGAQAQHVVKGQLISLGDESEQWCLEDAAPPDAVLMAEESGAVLTCVDGVICIPDANAPMAMVRHNSQGWLLEHSEGTQRLNAGKSFALAGDRWVLRVPPEGLETTQQNQWNAEESSFLDVRLEIAVSSDLEDVRVAAVQGERRIDAGRHACFYVLYILANGRWAEGAEQTVRSALGNPSPEGWVETKRLRETLGSQVSENQLNVDIYRIRQAFRRANIVDASSVIERERRRLRIGTPKGRIVSLEDYNG